MVEKRPLQDTVIGGSSAAVPMAIEAKKIKVEQTSQAVVQSTISTVTASSASASPSISISGEGQSSLPVTTTPPTALHTNMGEAQRPVIRSPAKITPGSDNVTIKKEPNTTVLTPKTNQSKLPAQVASAPIRTNPQPTPVMTISTQRNIKKEPTATANGPLLSNSICNSNRSTNLSVSTLSSGESSGRKGEISSLSSASCPDTDTSRSGPISASIAPLGPIVTPGTAALNNASTLTASTPAPSLGEKKPTPPPPLKSTKMIHLRTKYLAQLEYMHREFKKLERQLLGAKTNSKSLVESSGSKERREKLHSFIVHLEETLKQIQLIVDDSSKSSQSGTSSASASEKYGETTELDEEAKKEFARSSALTKLTKEKEEEENVQKLEEHILANLLPVKERLTKQLAAQQGAARNPVGMPVRRGLQPVGTSGRGRNPSIGSSAQSTNGALNPPSTGPLTGSRANSQFGRPLKGGGSSLTKKLHGGTLGSQGRHHGVGVGVDTKAPISISKGIQITPKLSSPEPTSTPRKVVYAGMTPGSKQVQSGVSAATGVHDMVIENARHQIGVTSNKGPVAPPPPPPSSIPKIKANTNPRPAPTPLPQSSTISKTVLSSAQPSQVKSASVPPPPPGLSMTVVPRTNNKSQRDQNLTEGEKQEKLVRKKMRKVEKQRVQQERQRQILLQQQQLQRQQQSSNAPRRATKPAPGAARVSSGQRKGPRTVEYICALCNEAYKSTCEYNPWWALSSHECAKCGKTQIPRLDISSPSNAIEYHPALLAHAATDDSGKNSNKAVSVSAVPKHYNRSHEVGSAPKSGSFDLLNEDIDFSGSDSDESEFGENMSPAAQAENEDFGKNYSGPKFTDYDASRLLILMAHASTCPGHHNTKKARDCCNNVKFMMMHVRDCPGTTPSYDICPFPWCRKTKHLLYHLVSCESPTTCQICSPANISTNLRSLHGLNSFRTKKRKEQHGACASSVSNSSNKGINGKVGSSGQTSKGGTTKKNSQQRRMSRNGTMPGGGRTNRLTKVNHSKHPALLAAQNGITKRSALSVPSPIPTAGLSSIKPTNPLATNQLSQSTNGRTQRPSQSGKQNLTTSFIGKSSNSSKVLKPAQISSLTTSHTLQGPANPLSIMHSNYPKMSSPPNPLKGLPVEQRACTPSFPALPNQIAIGGDNKGNDNHHVLKGNTVKIKVDGTH